MIPIQKKGKASGAEHVVDCTNEADAMRLFEKGKQRLLDVNNWHRYCTVPSAVFRLTDPNGNEVNGAAGRGLLIRIDVPGPGNDAGAGYDWVRIEEMQEENSTGRRQFSFRVRPVESPLTPSQEKAHFYRDDATSTFMVKLHGCRVTALEAGRNEVPNTEGTMWDKLRNFLFAATASRGAAWPQWKGLMKGILEN